MSTFCTYFDHRYLSRGLALIESIRQHYGNANFYVLALNSQCYELLKKINLDGVTPISLNDVEDHLTDLKRVKLERKTIEYYFTLTPALPKYIFEKYSRNVELLTYIDCDTYFFSSPEPVFASMQMYSIGVTPHRFSDDRLQLEAYGKFNVGWISWRNNEIGKSCIDEYYINCIDWCHDVLDGERFGDQKYLDKWPITYKTDLKILDHIGLNAARWNINRHRVSQHTTGQVMIDDEPLIFWHYSASLEPGASDQEWGISTTHPDMLAINPALKPLVYDPYIAAIQEKNRFLYNSFDFLLEDNEHLRYGAQPAQKNPKENQGYRKVARGQTFAEESQGWHDREVVNRQHAAYRRLLEEMHQGRPRLDLAIAAQCVDVLGLSRVNLLEIGCGSGYYSEIFETLCKTEVDYTGIDYSEEMIRLARHEYPKQKFLTANAKALPFPDAHFDIVFNGVSLMHILDYPLAIQEAARTASRYVIFHTVTLSHASEDIYVNKNAYGGLLSEVIISEQNLRWHLVRAGLFIRGVFDSITYNVESFTGTSTYTKTFVCQKFRTNNAREPVLVEIQPREPLAPGWIFIGGKLNHPAIYVPSDLLATKIGEECADVILWINSDDLGSGARLSAFAQNLVRGLVSGGLLLIANSITEKAGVIENLGHVKLIKHQDLSTCVTSTVYQSLGARLHSYNLPASASDAGFRVFQKE